MAGMSARIKAIALCLQAVVVHSFTQTGGPSPLRINLHHQQHHRWNNVPLPVLYASTSPIGAPYPKVGDVVRYEDLDGGKANGQTLIGRISLIQPVLQQQQQQPNNNNVHNNTIGPVASWIAEITQLDDLGDGYYSDFSSRKRQSKRSLRPIDALTPLPAAFVRSEMAWKVPSKPTWPRYNLVGYAGPQTDPTTNTVNMQILQQDKIAYNQLKIQLLKDAALFGLGGTFVVQFLRGLDDALIYLAGALAGVGYLFFLSVKTDTVGTSSTTATTTPQTLQGLQQGNKIANIRFLLPFFVLMGVAIRNSSLNLDSTTTVTSQGFYLLHTVTPEQFGAAMLGFLTYRIPLLLNQLGPVVADAAGLDKNKSNLPTSSLGIALQLAQDSSTSSSSSSSSSSRIPPQNNLQTILMVSGPTGTGKSTLVQKLIQEGKGKFVEPKYIDRFAEPVTFERLISKGDMLYIDPTDRFGLTLDGIRKPPQQIIQQQQNVSTSKPIVVIDANVDLAKKLTQVANLRIVGVWIGLDSLEKFEQRIKTQIESGYISIPSDETPESVLRGKIRQIVKDIEYGIVSGIFEFTILNDDMEASLEQLQKAAAYCLEDSKT